MSIKFINTPSPIGNFVNVRITNSYAYISGQGAFDDNGVTASCIVDNEGEKFLYYIGWKPRSTTRFGLMTGLAISDDGGETFRRYSRAPILKLTDREPYWILTAPFVLKDESDWKMWYVSCEGWIHADLPTYNIKLATSNDGINWEQTGKVCLDFIDYQYR